MSCDPVTVTSGTFAVTSGAVAVIRTRPSSARSPRKPALFEFGTGFLPSETGAPKGA